MTYSVYTYDVWGNNKDGYEVNDVYSTVVKDLFIDPDATDIEIIHCLKQCEILGKFVKNSKYRIDGEFDNTLYVVYEPKEYPVCEIRLNT